MRAIGISGVLLAGLISVGAANGQSAAPAGDPHHPRLEQGTSGPTAEGAARDKTTPTGEAQTGATMPPGTMQMGATTSPSPGTMQMGAMMSPEMMQMMMQMMAQHHAGGSMTMPGGSAAMRPDAGGPGGTDDYAGLTPGAILGIGSADTPEMTPALVQTWLQDRLDRLGNPRLKLGEIAEAADGSITAEIRTTDGAVVQKLAFNRFPGLFRQIN